MSTRSLIARKTETGWEGIYHHWDGYPEALGATLFELFNGHFDQDAKTMLAFLLDEHRGGWSTINGADFSLPAGFSNSLDMDTPHGPRCFCHGDRSEGPLDLVTEATASAMGAEYCYVIDSDTSVMTVLERKCDNDAHATSMFGMDAGDVLNQVRWEQIGEVPLMALEPDWKSL